MVEIEKPADAVLSVAVARGAYDVVDEHLTVELDGTFLEATEVELPHGSRFHRVQAAPGCMTVDYDATVDGLDEIQTVEPADEITYLRPSRYAQSDELLAVAEDLFPVKQFTTDQVNDIARWVWETVSYVPSSSGPTDGATETFLQRSGVCRDFAHLTTALLRAREIPARLVSVYAPGLFPMDFHAVVEAAIDGVWYVVDATRLAPRRSMLRIATGSDATDTAFLSTYRGAVTLSSLAVTAVADELPEDDHVALTRLR